MILLLLFVVGLCAGSFAFAMTLRMYDGRDWVKGRSECDKCHKPLKWVDLFPLFSWLSTSGKCRYCKKKLGASYPLVELVTGMLFASSYVLWPFGFTRLGVFLFGFWLIMLTLLVSLIIFDVKWFILPDKIVYTLVGIAGVSKLAQVFYYQDFSILVDVLGGVGVGAGVFYALYLVSKGRYIGGGDVKYGLFFGVLLASPFKSLLVISMGSFIGTFLILPSLLKKKTKMTSQVPFGPSLIMATIIVYLLGGEIINFLTTNYLFP